MAVAGTMARVSPGRSVLLSAIAVLAAACGGTPAIPGPASPSPASAATSDAPPTPVPGATAEASDVLQTETEWGRIWDAVPATFPRHPAAVPTETGEGPVSASFAVGAPAGEVAAFMQAALETAGFSTEALSGPLEDGSIVIDSVGDPLGCRVQTRVVPRSGTTHMTILYGADCRFD